MKQALKISPLMLLKKIPANFRITQNPILIPISISISIQLTKFWSSKRNPSKISWAKLTNRRRLRGKIWRLILALMVTLRQSKTNTILIWFTEGQPRRPLALQYSKPKLWLSKRQTSEHSTRKKESKNCARNFKASKLIRLKRKRLSQLTNQE